MRQCARALVGAAVMIALAMVQPAATAGELDQAAGDRKAGVQADTVVDLKTAAAQTGLLGRMAEIKSLAGLDGAASGDMKLTIFAPSDAAFEALPKHIRTALLEPDNRRLLADLLLHHAVIGEYPTERLLKASARHYGVEAIDGSMIEFTIKPRTGHIDIHGAKVVRSDILASNGILHVIDKVLIPRSVMTALENPGSQLTAAAE